MHIRTNIELSYIQIVILAVCPLLVVMDSLKIGLYFIGATAICYFVSALICAMFNKHFKKSVKIFMVALISSFVVTIINYFFADKFLEIGINLDSISIYVIISTMLLSTDIVYINTRALVNNYLFKMVRAIFAYAVIVLIYSTIKEFLAYGTFFGRLAGKYMGSKFFESMIFNLLYLGLIGVIAEAIIRVVSKFVEKRDIAYQKLLKRVKHERVFHYDSLRREKRLIAEVEINHINSEEMEKIYKQENETELDDNIFKAGIVAKKRKRKPLKRLKFSSETKLEKMYYAKRKGGKK